MQNAGDTISITVNGEERQSGAATIAALLAELEIADSAVVAEHNGAIVRRDAFAATALSDGDRVELVRFVGGG